MSIGNATSVGASDDVVYTRKSSVPLSLGLDPDQSDHFTRWEDAALGWTSSVAKRRIFRSELRPTTKLSLCKPRDFHGYVPRYSVVAATAPFNRSASDESHFARNGKEAKCSHRPHGGD